MISISYESIEEFVRSSYQKRDIVDSDYSYQQELKYAAATTEEQVRSRRSGCRNRNLFEV